MIFQFIASALGIAGYVFGFPILFLIGGIGCLLLEVYGFFSGALNPIFPIILYIIGITIVGSFWHGILLGAILSVGFEIIMLAVGMLGFGLYAKLKGKTDEVN